VNKLHPDLFQNLDMHVENLVNHENKIIKKMVLLRPFDNEPNITANSKPRSDFISPS